MTINPKPYPDFWLPRLQDDVGKLFAYLTVIEQRDLDTVAELFATSHYAWGIEHGISLFCLGHSAPEMLQIILNDEDYPIQDLKGQSLYTEEYWVGWVLTYYQWYSGLCFQDILKYLPASEMVKHYILHEAGLEKTVSVFDSYMKNK